MLIAYVILIIAVGMDLKRMRISNRLILISLGMALIRRYFCEGIPGIFTGIILISIPIILLYLLFLAGALGAGDIKLFSVVGGFVNLRELIWCMLFAFLFAAVWSLWKMFRSRRFISSMQNAWCYLQKCMLFGLKKYEPDDRKASEIHFSIAILLGFTVMDICIS